MKQDKTTDLKMAKLTPRSTVLREKLTRPQLVNKFPEFLGN